MAKATQAASLASLSLASGLGGYYSTNYFLLDTQEITDNETTNTVSSEPNDVIGLIKSDVGVDTLLALLKEENLPKIVKNISENQDWWKWAYENKYANKDNSVSLDPLFQDLNDGFSGNLKSLNNACNEAYKKSKTDYTFENSYLLDNINLFCTHKSANVVEPVASTYANDVIDDPYNNGILTVSNNKDSLVKGNDNNNDYWWKWAYEKLLKPNLANATDTFRNVNSSTALSQACDAAYKLNKETFYWNSQSFNEVSLFCSSTRSPLLLPNDEPANVTTHGDTDTSQEYANKFLDLTNRENLKHLVKSNVEVNKEWWEWSFEKRYTYKKTNSGQFHEVFNGITEGYGTNNTSLNVACENAYKKGREQYSFDNHLLDNIKSFCTRTYVGQDVSEPKATVHTEVLSTAEYANGVLSVSSNKDKLVKKEGTNNNDLWWNWAYKKLITNDNKKSADPTFTTLEKGYDANNNDKALNVACDNAYKQNRDALEANSNKLFKSIKKFCTKGIAEQTLSLPAEPKFETEPESRTRFAASLESSEYENNTVLAHIKKTNVVKVIKPHVDGNKDWWRWSHQKKYTGVEDSKLHTVFKNVTSGYSNSKANNKALNQACYQAYKLGISNYKFEDNDYLLKNIARFCVEGNDPNLDISEPEAKVYEPQYQASLGYAYGVLSVSDNKSKLVNKDNNPLWWKWAYKNLVKDKNQGESYGFEVITSGDSKEDSSKSLLSVCDESYKKNAKDLENQDSKLLKLINKYCSVDRTEGVIKLPDNPEPSSVNFLKDAKNNKPTFKLELGGLEKNQSKLVDTGQSRDWWKWSFTFNFSKYKDNKDQLVEPFAAVTSDYDGSKPNALNVACRTAYSKLKEDLEKENGSKKKLIDLVKEFCVPGNISDKNLEIPNEPQEPSVTQFLKNSSKVGSYDSDFAKDEKNNSILVDPESNQNWWEWIFDYVYKNPKKTDKYKLDAPFKDTVIKLGFSSEENNSKALNQACKAAYKMSKTNLNNKKSNYDSPIELVKRYCVPTNKPSQNLNTSHS